jgi:hypothetical protein
MLARRYHDRSYGAKALLAIDSAATVKTTSSISPIFSDERNSCAHCCPDWIDRVNGHYKSASPAP